MLPGADFALLAVLLLHHSQVRIVTEAGLAKDGKLGLFPVHAIVGVCTFRGRHGWIFGEFLKLEKKTVLQFQKKGSEIFTDCVNQFLCLSKFILRMPYHNSF